MHPPHALLVAVLLLPRSALGAKLGPELSLSYGAPPAGGVPSPGFPQGDNFPPGLGADDLNSPSLGGNDITGGAGAPGSDEFGPPPPIPATSFQCGDYEYPGYYADVEAQCTVFHICQEDGRHDAFLCPQDTLFNQKYLVCDWPAAVDCQNSDQFFSVNAEIGKIPDGKLPSPGGNLGFLPGAGSLAPAFDGVPPAPFGVANPPSTSYGLPN